MTDDEKIILQAYKEKLKALNKFQLLDAYEVLAKKEATMSFNDIGFTALYNRRSICKEVLLSRMT